MVERISQAMKQHPTFEPSGSTLCGLKFQIFHGFAM